MAKDETRWLVWCCGKCNGYVMFKGKKPRRKHKGGTGCYVGEEGKAGKRYLSEDTLKFGFPERLHPKEGGKAIKLEFK